MRNSILLFFLFITSFVSFNSNEEAKDVIVIFKEQLDTNQIPSFRNKEDKGRYVFEQTQKIADQSQKRIIQYLNHEHLEYQSFHIINAIQIKKIHPNQYQFLTQFEEIDYIQEDLPVPSISYDRIPNTDNYSRDIQWGISNINADKVWEELGIRGKNAVIAGQDTGYDWTHPALMNSYRGWNGIMAEHDYHWHDAIREYSALHSNQTNNCGLDIKEPCDDNGHGTHTMGTMVGVADDMQIGVAPEAKWIACRNMERGWGTPSSYIECFEWFLAPTDLNNEHPDVAMSPHVINNSWACPAIEGCNPDNYNTMKVVVDNLKAAGIFVVVSAGNNGLNGCGSVDAPAGIFESSFTVGASDIEDTLAYFSSMGPVTTDGSGRLKPNVVAPGVDIQSSTLGNGYGNSSGTSMAGPHVAGVVALMIAANPDLAGQVEQLETILEQTAVPIHTLIDECDGISSNRIPNPIFGFGKIDAYAAVKAAMEYSFDYNEQDVFVYPNPSNDIFHFLIPEFKGQYSISIWNMKGEWVHEQQLTFGVNGSFLSLGHLANGVYYYQINGSEGISKTGKLVRI